MDPATADIAFPFQERFAEIDVPGSRVSQIKVFFLATGNYPPEWTPPPSGAHRVLDGAVPIGGPKLRPDLARLFGLS